MKQMARVAVLLCLAAIPGMAQSASGGNVPDQQTHAQAPVPSSQENQPMQRLNLTMFTGKIVKDTQGKYFLQNVSSNIKYLLDNQKEASKYERKSVSIEGSLVPPGNVLHVKKIETTP